MTQHPFDLLMELETEDIRLDCAALHIARDTYPNLVFEAYLEQLDALADDVSQLRAGLSAAARYQALREVLVEKAQFRGNQDDYYNPENSYLNRVLDTRLGIPISLAIVWVEVGRRLNWPVAGVGFPGHYLVRIDDPERFVIVDAHGGGRSLSIDDCKKLLQQQFEGKLTFTGAFLEATDTRGTLVRLLNNLRTIYSIKHDGSRLADVLRRLDAAEPGNGRHLLELADLLFRMGNVRGAQACLAESLRRQSTDEERAAVQRNFERLQAAIAALN